MYCIKCGKQIDYDSTVCIACARAAKEEAARQNAGGGYYANFAQEENAYQSFYSYEPIKTEIFEPQPKKSTRMAGFGKALAGVIMAEIAAMLVAGLAEMLLLDAVFSIVLSVIMLPLAILGLVFGIQSIKTFKTVKQQGGDMPIPTLIMGIVSLANSALVLFIVSLCLFLLPTML